MIVGFAIPSIYAAGDSGRMESKMNTFKLENETLSLEFNKSSWPTYQNTRGYYGSDYPVQYHGSVAFCGAPMSPFFLMRSESQGLYAGICEASPELVAWNTELRPGYGSSIDSRVPEGLEISGKDVVTRFAAVHLPYVMPGETRSLTPVALEAFEGGWQQGVNIYKLWRGGWAKSPQAPAWAREPHS